MNYAPSRYEFKSEQEFQTAMSEWCAENEPQFSVKHRTPEGWVETPFDSEDEAAQAIASLSTPEHRAFICRRVAGKYKEAPKFARPERYYPVKSIDHLDGGSRDDYRLAGITRY